MGQWAMGHHRQNACIGESSLCAMRHAPCAMRHAPCAMRHAINVLTNMTTAIAAVILLRTIGALGAGEQGESILFIFP